MHVINSKFGNDGYATWVKILRLLAVTNYHFIDLQDEGDLLFVSSKCNVSEEMLIEIIDTLVKLGEFDRELWIERRVIWSEKFIESIQDAYAKRKNKPMNIDRLKRDFLGFTGPFTPQKDSKHPDCVDSGAVNPQTILYYTKEKQTKEETQKGEFEIFEHAEIVSFVNENFGKEFTDRNLTRFCRDCINDLITVHGYTKEKVFSAWRNITKDPFHVSKKFNIVRFEYLAKPETVGRYLFWKDEKPVTGTQQARTTHLNSGDDVDWETQTAKQ